MFHKITDDIDIKALEELISGYSYVSTSDRKITKSKLKDWKFAGDSKYFTKLVKIFKDFMPEDIDVCCCGNDIDVKYYITDERYNYEIVCSNCANYFIPTFMERLRKFVGSDFKDWEYVGGVENESHLDSMDYTELQAWDSDCARKFKEKFECKRDFPEYKNRCGCGHKIVRNDYIYNKKTDEIKILGSTCIKKFIPKALKSCIKCGTYHNNRTRSECNRCLTVRIDCRCGGRYNLKTSSRHFNTKKHKRYIESLN